MKINKKELLFFIVLIIFCIAKCTLRCVPDNDLWTRLLVGSSIIDGFSIIKQDIFSYLPTHIWYDHEWGASVFIYGFFKLFHEWGLILLKALLTIGIVISMVLTVKLKEPKHTTPYNILLYAIAYLAASYVLNGTVRCHLFTFFFFTIFLYILEKVRLQKFKHWWIMPLIMLFWSNTHGGCVSGIGLLVMYLIGEALNKKPVDFYIKALISSCLITFINPWGIGYVIFLLKATTMNRELILEWRGTFETSLLKPYIYFKLYFYFMALIGIITFIKKLYKKDTIDWTKLIVLLATVYLAIAHIKHQPFFVIAWTIFLYDDIYEILGSMFRKIPEKITSQLLIVKDVISYIIVIWLSLIFISYFERPVTITTTAYPYYALEFIKVNDLKGKLFINFDWGSYAEYKLFPYNKIVMDGRYEEVFPPELIYKISDFHMLKNDHWYDIIEMYPPDIMVIEKKYPVYNEMLKKTNWLLVFENNITGVFISEQLKKDKYIYPPTDINYYEQTKFDKNFSFVKRIKKE